MEVPADLSSIFETNCVRLDSHSCKKFNTRKYPYFANMIDKIGKLSAEAQKMKRVLTTYDKLLESEDQILYLLWETCADRPNLSLVIGFLKVGRRNLYLYDEKLKCYQRRPMCVLDFYVHFSRQRQGNGKILYDAMLHGENLLPLMIAIDKPSESLLAFLRKHYKLSDPVWQNTNYVVFPGFFESPDQLPEAENNPMQISLPTQINNGSSPVVTTTVSSSPAKVKTPVSSPTLSLEPQTVVTSPVKPLYIEATPPGTPSSGATSLIVSFADNPPPVSPSSSSRLAKDRKVMSLGHQKLW